MNSEIKGILEGLSPREVLISKLFQEIKRLKKLGPSWIGSIVSKGTLKSVDLISACIKVADEIARVEVTQILDGYKVNRTTNWNAWINKNYELADALEEELFQLVDAIAPEGTSFTAHPSDDSLFGFWTFEDLNPTEFRQHEHRIENSLLQASDKEKFLMLYVDLADRYDQDNVDRIIDGSKRIRSKMSGLRITKSDIEDFMSKY